MTTTLGSLAIQRAMPAGAAVLIDLPSPTDPTKRTFGKATPEAVAAAMQDRALLDAVEALVPNLPTAAPAKPGKLWLDVGTGTLRFTSLDPGGTAPPPQAAPQLLGPDDAVPLTGPTDGAPLLSPTGV